MTDTPEALFLTFRSRGDAAALASVFDRTAPELGASLATSRAAMPSGRAT